MAINRTSPKKGKVVDIPANAPTIGTPTAGAASVSVAFTAPSTATGGPITKYQAVSSPGSITGTATSSPVVVTGLTNGTAYTFTVAAGNATGYGPYSAASASATPVDAASYVSIATVTVSTAVNTITFSSIPSTYKHLEIRSLGRIGSGNYGPGEAYMRFNSDTTYGNYYGHYLQAGGPTPSTGAGVSTPGTNARGVQLGMLTGGSAASTLLGGGITSILDYADTNKYKVSMNIAGADFNGAPGGTAGYVTMDSGVWMSTSAITRIDITPWSTELFQSPTTFALYGIKG